MGRRKRNLLKEISLKKMSRFTIIPIETIMSHDYLRIMAEPFASKAQMRWMFAKKPAMAKRWAKKTKNTKSLPDKVKKKGKKRR